MDIVSLTAVLVCNHVCFGMLENCPYAVIEQADVDIHSCCFENMHNNAISKDENYNLAIELERFVKLAPNSQVDKTGVM